MQTTHGDVLTSDVPKDYQAERAILCCILVLGTDSDLLKVLKPEYFASEWYRWIYEKLKEHRRKQWKTEKSALDYVMSREHEARAKGITRTAWGLGRIIQSGAEIEYAHYYLWRLKRAAKHRRAVERARKAYLWAWEEWDEAQHGKGQDISGKSED